jgi:large subunit ribosomal protein L6
MNNFYFSKLIQIQKNNIEILKKGTSLLIKGPLGLSSLELPKNILFRKSDKDCCLFGVVAEKNLILTYYKILLNKIRGVDLGFFEILVVSGVGWRIALKNNILVFSLGYSHIVEYGLRVPIEITIYDKQRFKVFGLDSEIVHQVVVDLCKLRTFNVYKAKGIYRYGQIHQLKISSKSKA